MSLIPLNLNEVQEPKPVPVGRYDLVIASCEETKTKEKGKPQFKISIGIEGHDTAPNVSHYIGIPAEGDEPNAMQFKALLLRRFLTLFKVPHNGASINTEQLAMDMVGCRANAALSLDSQKDRDGNEVVGGAVYNRLEVPKLAGEGSPTAGRVSPQPPKR